MLFELTTISELLSGRWYVFEYASELASINRLYKNYQE